MVQELLSPSKARDRAFQMASSDYLAALAIAHQIDDPWFRCQALTFVAKACPEHKKRQLLLQEAFAAAMEMHGPNRQVTVAAWPLSVLALAGEFLELTSTVEHLVGLIAQEPSPVRRAHALRAVLSSLAQDACKAHYLRVLPLFAEACLSPLESGKRNRRGESSLAEAVSEIYRFSPQEAEDLVLKIRGPVLRARGLNAITRAKAHKPESRT